MRTFQELHLGKIDKNQSLKIKLEQLPEVKIIMIPVVVGALGVIADRLHDWLSQIPGTINKVELLKSAFLEIELVFPVCSQTPRTLV